MGGTITVGAIMVNIRTITRIRIIIRIALPVAHTVLHMGLTRIAPLTIIRTRIAPPTTIIMRTTA